MGIERARVVEVHGETSPAGAVGSGYFVTDRLVLTWAGNVGRRGSTAVRPAGTGPWVPATVAWTSSTAGASLLEVDDAGALLVAPNGVRWGEVAGPGAIGVTATGFPPAEGRPARFRDPVQFYGRMGGGDKVATSSLPVTANGPSPGTGMSGAALFAGADLVGVLVVDTDATGPQGPRAIAVAALARDGGFGALVAPQAGLRLVPVRAPALPLPILQMP